MAIIPYAGDSKNRHYANSRNQKSFKAKVLDYSYKYETNLYGFQLHSITHKHLHLDRCRKKFFNARLYELLK